MSYKHQLGTIPDLHLVDYPEKFCFKIYPDYDSLQTFVSLNYGLEHDKKDIESMGKIFIAAPKMLEAIIRFQDEYVVNGNAEQRANNYTIEKQFQAAIENIFKP